MQLRAIRDGLAALLPERSAAIGERTAAYEMELAGLFADGARRMAVHRGKQVITFHDAWAYFARDIGIRVAAVVTPVPGVEGSLKHRETLQRLVRTGEVAALFVEPQFDPSVGEMIAATTGARVYSLDAGETTAKAIDEYSYVEVMRGNFAELERALGAQK